MSAQTHLNLAKQNFKFSSAHFLIFDKNSAEMLHGHNYQVEVKIYPRADFNFDESGYFVDFSVVKAKVKALCDLWDEHILLPALHADMKHKLSADQKNYEVTFRDRFYSFPKNEIVWLPLTNTSVEQLSKLFAQALHNQLSELKNSPVARVEVTIEETRGQSATSQFAL